MNAFEFCPFNCHVMKFILSRWRGGAGGGGGGAGWRRVDVVLNWLFFCFSARNSEACRATCMPNRERASAKPTWCLSRLTFPLHYPDLMDISGSFQFFWAQNLKSTPETSKRPSSLSVSVSLCLSLSLSVSLCLSLSLSLSLLSANLNCLQRILQPSFYLLFRNE
jgi:hypothetical protein